MSKALSEIQHVSMANQVYSESERQSLLARLCEVLDASPEDLRALLAVNQRCQALETECARLRREIEASTATAASSTACSCRDKVSAVEKRCDNIWEVTRRACCPGNILYSQVTLDEYSDNRQVLLSEPIVDFGPGFVNSFPVPPGQAIRLEHLPRPGYMPEAIAIDFALANNGTNYLDLEIEFFLTPGGKIRGKSVGPVWSGNEFLNKDGTQIQIPMPKYRGKLVEVGSIERMAVEIRHGGAVNNLVSAKVRLPFDEESWYRYCASRGLGC